MFHLIWIQFIRLFGKLNNHYRNQLSSDYHRRMRNPIKSMWLDFGRALGLISALIIVFILISPALRNAVDYSIDHYTKYKTEINKVKKDLNEAKNDMFETYLASMRRFKNPEFDGIATSKIDKLISIYPASIPPKTKIVFFKIAKWAAQEGYDGIIFGDSYSGLNGTFYWTDDIDSDHDVDFELLVNMLKRKGCRKIFSCVSNPENKTLFPHVNNYIKGDLIISKVGNYRLQSVKFWRCGTSTIVHADNFECEINNENKLIIVRRPAGENNRLVEHLPQRKGVIKSIKDGSTSFAKKVEALINMADTIGGENEN